MSEQAKAPAYRVQLGRIQGTVWPCVDAKGGTWYSVNLCRKYRDTAGAVKTAHTYGRDDLLVVAEVARMCWLWIADRVDEHGYAGNTPTEGQT